MSTDVTKKDKTLKQVIDYCQHERDRVNHVARGDDPAWNGGESFALLAVIDYCKDMLGYGGSMPLEVPNQSEDAK